MIQSVSNDPWIVSPWVSRKPSSTNLDVLCFLLGDVQIASVEEERALRKGRVIHKSRHDGRRSARDMRSRSSSNIDSEVLRV